MPGSSHRRYARPEEVEWLAYELEKREAAAKVTPGSVWIVASIESAAALIEAPRIAKASDRLIGLMFGSEDFALDLGLPAKREGEAADMLYPRSAIVIAAVSAGKVALDGIWPDIGDPAGLRADSLRARRLGFSGKTLIHPDQIAVVNEIFSPVRWRWTKRAGSCTRSTKRLLAATGRWRSTDRCSTRRSSIVHAASCARRAKLLGWCACNGGGARPGEADHVRADRAERSHAARPGVVLGDETVVDVVALVPEAASET